MDFDNVVFESDNGKNIILDTGDAYLLLTNNNMAWFDRDKKY